MVYKRLVYIYHMYPDIRRLPNSSSEKRKVAW